MKSEVEIIIAKSAGVCFGVERALNLTEAALEKKLDPITSLGPLIHNPIAVSELSEKGLKIAENLDGITGTVVFRSHGVTLQTQKIAEEKKLKVIDATCPLVKVPQNFARKLAREGYFVVIVGDQNHPEIKGVKSYVENGEVSVVKVAGDVADLPSKDKVGVICQTTLKKQVFLEVVEACKRKYKEVKVHNTICGATRDRQDAAYALSEMVDCVVVIGGRNSSNTQKLYDISLEKADKAYLVESEQELKSEWFSGITKVGITAGASTPHTLIEKVRSRIAEITQIA